MCIACASRVHGMVCAWRVHGVCMVHAWATTSRRHTHRRSRPTLLEAHPPRSPPSSKPTLLEASHCRPSFPPTHPPTRPPATRPPWQEHRARLLTQLRSTAHRLHHETGGGAPDPQKGRPRGSTEAWVAAEDARLALSVDMEQADLALEQADQVELDATAAAAAALNPLAQLEDELYEVAALEMLHRSKVALLYFSTH
jgi:hypothetical protein